MTEPEFLTLKEAGDLARCPAETVRYWVQKGRLKGYRPGLRLLVRRSDVIALIEASETVAVRAAADALARKARG